MANFETGGTRNLDPTDFGEPTHETRIAFASAIERLKSITVGMPYEHVIRIGEATMPRTPLPDGLGPITEYEYEQCKDPLFDIEERTDFGFHIIEASDETFAKWFSAQGEEKICQVHYSDGIIDMHYEYSPSEERLSISDFMEVQAMPGTPEWREQLSRLIRSVEDPRDNGADRPTEGTMRQFLTMLEQEIAKRII